MNALLTYLTDFAPQSVSCPARLRSAARFVRKSNGRDRALCQPGRQKPPEVCDRVGPRASPLLPRAPDGRRQGGQADEPQGGRGEGHHRQRDPRLLHWAVPSIYGRRGDRPHAMPLPPALAAR
eukprot:scaffold260123_cov35-Prasinocladus_malaysianus.AAC.1